MKHDYRGASYLKVEVERDRELSDPPKKRGEITEFTDAARRRMLDQRSFTAMSITGMSG